MDTIAPPEPRKWGGRKTERVDGFTCAVGQWRGGGGGFWDLPRVELRRAPQGTESSREMHSAIQWVTPSPLVREAS